MVVGFAMNGHSALGRRLASTRPTVPSFQSCVASESQQPKPQVISLFIPFPCSLGGGVQRTAPPSSIAGRIGGFDLLVTLG